MRIAGKGSANETLPKTERPRREGGSQDELTATGRRKRKDVGAKREGTAKGWTEEEERLFLEGLELFGREWHKAAAHVGNLLCMEACGVNLTWSCCCSNLYNSSFEMESNFVVCFSLGLYTAQGSLILGRMTMAEGTDKFISPGVP